MFIIIVKNIIAQVIRKRDIKMPKEKLISIYQNLLDLYNTESLSPLNESNLEEILDYLDLYISMGSENTEWTDKELMKG